MHPVLLQDVEDRSARVRGPHTATDPDAAWFVREGDHRDPSDTPGGGAKRKKAKRIVYGFEATLVVTGETSPGSRGYSHNPNPDNEHRLPALVLAFTVHEPGHDPAGNALTALRDVHRRGYRPGRLTADKNPRGCPPGLPPRPRTRHPAPGT
ncbi:hypothetical protein [Streptomyces virginiae]|uniref:hypothetical protein n=1 Tax=Streptomyces virginiae TaxID=1961 RepID=UPI002DDB255F|nr:hypothetical protein [Streptomyces virginiae]WSC80766.1 hypothetical protein OHA56_32995 [Streptomyces virginiae]